MSKAWVFFFASENHRLGSWSTILLQFVYGKWSFIHAESLGEYFQGGKKMSLHKKGEYLFDFDKPFS